MRMTLEERERAAYISGDVVLARLLAVADEADTLVTDDMEELTEEEETAREELLADLSNASSELDFVLECGFAPSPPAWAAYC